MVVESKFIFKQVVLFCLDELEGVLYIIVNKWMSTFQSNYNCIKFYFAAPVMTKKVRKCQN